MNCGGGTISTNTDNTDTIPASSNDGDDDSGDAVVVEMGPNTMELVDVLQDLHKTVVRLEKGNQGVLLGHSATRLDPQEMIVVMMMV